MRSRWLSLVAVVGLACVPHDPVPGAGAAPDPTVPIDAGRNVIRLSPVSHQALQAYSPVQTACQRDADCELVGALRTGSNQRGCCLQCGVYLAGNRAWAQQAVGACLAAGPCSLAESCVQPTIRPYDAVCTQGQCVLQRSAAFRQANGSP